MKEHLELWLAFLACLLLSFFYIIYALVTLPAGGQPVGELMGIVGMTLMVVTETIYSLRKRLPWLEWAGSMRLWLSFHILTGIVGPFLVLLHSAFHVGGLAGFALWMTGIVVASGFVGRYIYTAVPRTRAGVEVTRDELTARAAAVEGELERFAAQKPAIAEMLAGGVTVAPAKPVGWARVFVRSWQELNYERRVRVALGAIERAERIRLGELKHLLIRRRQLERQVESLEWVHRLMGAWRSVHVPLGVALFTAAGIHVVAALYFKGFVF